MRRCPTKSCAGSRCPSRRNPLPTRANHPPTLARRVSNALRKLASRVANSVSRSPNRPDNAPKKRGAITVLPGETQALPERRRLAHRPDVRRRHPAVEAPRLASLAILLAVALSPGARADTGEAQARFAEARAAFELGDFPRALLLYEQCLALGMQGPAIHYNIGVAAYRGGDLARAEQAFREVARTPAMAALADYNLGLVALRRDEPGAARAWFERAQRESTDEKLSALAARRLGELPRAPTRAPASWYARAGAGYDGNVALRSASVEAPGSGEGDAFADLLVAGSYSFDPAWRVDAAAGLVRYETLDAFDQTALSLGAARGFAPDRWYLELGGYATQLSFGGDVYERAFAAAAHATRSFDGLGTLRAQVHLSTVDGERDFSGLSGTRSEFGVRYETTWRAVSLAADTRAEFNDSEDAAFASRWLEIGAETDWAASPLLSFGAGVRWRKTQHPAQPGQQAWDDRRTTFRLEATRTLWQRTQLAVRYEHESNASPIDGYDYRRNWLSACLEFWR